jgi:hypothetical protein
MRPRFKEEDLDAEVLFDRSLVGGHELDVLQDALLAAAPRWCAALRVWKSARDQRPIDASVPGALAEAVVAAARERGPTYAALVARYGRQPLERLSGSVELRGADAGLVVVASLDELVLSPLGDRKNLGNGIHVQVRRGAVQGRPGGAWLRDLFTALCGRLSPAWGWAGSPAEYWARAMSEAPAVQAVGRDFGRHLPGLFWLNFFGGRLRQAIGDERLLSAPAPLVRRLDGGVLLGLAGDPGAWDSPGRRAAEEAVRRHLGDGLFFSRDRPGEPAAEWNVWK